MSDTHAFDASRPGALALKQGRESANAGQWISALAAYDQAQLAHADWQRDPDFLNDRAVALFHNQRTQEGLQLLNEAIDLQPNYGYRYAARGWMKQAMKDIAGAIADYEKAIALDPEDAITLNNLGLLEEQVGRAQSAKERFRMADAMDQVLEERNIQKAPAAETKPKPTPAPPPGPPPAQPSAWLEIKGALFTSKGRKEFLDFIRNGFKLNG